VFYVFFLCCSVFCVENRVCVGLAFLVSCCTDCLLIMSLFDAKKIFFSIFFLLLFLTYQTPKPDRMELKPNAIGRFGVTSLQVGFGAQYVKTESLGSLQKLPSTPTDPNRLHPYLYVMPKWCNTKKEHEKKDREPMT